MSREMDAKEERIQGSYAPVRRNSAVNNEHEIPDEQTPRQRPDLRRVTDETIEMSPHSPAGDPRPETPHKLRLQHGAIVRVDHPLTESEFKRQHRIKKSKYQQVEIDATPGAHAGEARISAGRQTCLQYMLACAAKREWSFWSTTTFFVACWMNITLAAIDIIGEKFGVERNYTYVSGVDIRYDVTSS